MKRKNRPPGGRPKASKRSSIWFRCGADVFCRIFQLFLVDNRCGLANFFSQNRTCGAGLLGFAFS